jgi:hypothetical protein
VDASIERLRGALERAAHARGQLALARADEVQALHELRARGLPWLSIAGGIVPPRLRRALARVLRQRYSERLRVGRPDRNLRAIDQIGAVSSGRAAATGPSCLGKEAEMPVEKVIRRVTVTEDFVAQEDELEGDDSIDDELEDEEPDESDGEAQPKTKGKKR